MWLRPVKPKRKFKAYYRNLHPSFSIKVNKRSRACIDKVAIFAALGKGGNVSYRVYERRPWKGSGGSERGTAAGRA